LFFPGCVSSNHIVRRVNLCGSSRLTEIDLDAVDSKRFEASTLRRNSNRSVNLILRFNRLLS